VQARDNPSVRVIIITGVGEKAFCVGADLKETMPPETSFAEGYFLPREQAASRGLYTRLFDLSTLEITQPLLAAVNVYCLGGGLEIALQCDLRISSDTARFGLPECVVASIPAVGGVQYLLRAIPSAIAMKMLLTGDRIDAQRALEVGLVSDVYPAQNLANENRELAKRIAANGPLAVQMIKKLAKDSTNVPLSEAIRMAEMAWGALRDTQDRIEGRKAFAERRKPMFYGH
jgi:E-phenylitaconyl-CoA hydratase